MWRFLAIISVGLLLAAPAGAAERTVEGYAAQNAKRLTLEDGFALRSARKDKVTLHLFPVAINERDIKAARAGQPWAIALRKPSPDPQMWEWCPTIEIDLQSVNGELESRSDLTFVNFMFTGLNRQNHTVNLTRSGDQARTSVTELALSERDGQAYVTIKSRASGLSYGDEHDYNWQIQASVPVYPAPQPDKESELDSDTLSR